jgi:hypothetical protein
LDVAAKPDLATNAMDHCPVLPAGNALPSKPKRGFSERNPELTNCKSMTPVTAPGQGIEGLVWRPSGPTAALIAAGDAKESMKLKI